jgi:dihydrofolate synthase/folylpolyglutamate synthase
MATEEQIAWAVDQVRGPIEQMRGEGKLSPSTFFEAYTAMAYLLFRRQKVDLAVMETGLGGRLDSTNTCEPVACAITTLGLDHTEILGNTLEQIAREKAGIIKAGVPVISAPQARAAAAVLHESAETVGAPLREPVPVTTSPATGGAGVLPAASQALTVQLSTGALDLQLPLAGEHQLTNLSVALGLVEALREQGYDLPDAAIAAGIRGVCLPGRMQIVAEKPWVIYDVAHNEPAAKAVAATLPCLVKYDRLIAVLGLSAEKDALAFCRELAPLVDVAILTRAKIERALPAEDLVRVSGELWKRVIVAADVPEAMALARREAGEGDCILVTGSFYVVGEVMELG